MVTQKWRIVAAYITLCVVWSSTWLAIKVGLADLPPISFAGLRFVIAFLVLLAVSIGRVPLLPKNRGDWMLLGSTGVLMFAVNYGLLFWGELHVSSGLAAVLQAVIVIFGMFFAHLLLPGEELRWQRVLGALLAGGGVALICGRLLEHGGMLAFWAGLGIVIGGAGAAFSNVLLKRRALELAPAMIAGWQMIFGSIPMVLLGLAVEGSPLRFHWTTRALVCLLYLAVIGSALTFLLL
ncbi:MAG TPA: EamA family transporter, partial [Chthoniobacterales bacterium]